MATNSILLVINKVCGYLDNISYVDIISVADTGKAIPGMGHKIYYKGLLVDWRINKDLLSTLITPTGGEISNIIIGKKMSRKY